MSELKVNYDQESDTLYLVTKKGAEEEHVELAPGVNIELDQNGKVIGVEILNASQILGSVVEKLRKAS